MTDPGDTYAGGRTSIDVAVQRPLYENAANLLKQSDGKAGLFDYWARGNYTRRMLHLRQTGVRPLLVPVSTVEEMRWAHRRLALIGAPVDFIYVGPLAAPTKCVHVLFLPERHVWDAGWGYIATQWKVQGRYAAMLVGTARLMPEEVVTWLLSEANDDFRDGNVFVAPAQLIGVDPEAADTLAPVASITGGSTVEPHQATALAFLELDIPYLDQMSPRSFQRFVREHDDDLARFRLAFGRLITESARDPERVCDWLAELRGEVADMRLSDRFSRLRRDIVVAGGTLGVFTACAGALTSAPETVSVVGASAAGAALLDLCRQALERRQARSTSRLSLFWHLGIQRASHVRRARRVHLTPNGCPAIPPALQPPASHHWLCPPTTGVLFAGVRK